MRQISLAEICTFAGGGKLKLTKSDYVKEGYPAFSAAGHDGFVSQYEFERLAIVVSAIGARCGKAFLAEGRWASLANTYCVFPNVTKVDPTFLWYQLNDENSWVKSGSAQPFIKPSDIKRRVVSFPTLEEQRRIAKLLDRAAEIRRRAEAARAKARSIIPALFLDTFGDPATNPMGWPVVKLGEVISEGPQNGLYRPASDYGRGVRILRIDSFDGGTITEQGSLKRVQIDDVSINRYGLKPNDIVINRVNSPPQLGKSVIVPALQERTVFESNMMRFRLDERILLPKILGVALQLENVRRSLIRNAKHAINQSSINQQDVGSLQVFQPPIALQVTYTEQCERVEGLVRTLDVAAVKAQAMAAALSAEVFDA